MHLAEHYAVLREWLLLHPDWIVFLVFGLAALEAVAVIGAIIPGVALMLALSIMAGSVSLDLTVVMVAGVLGAMAGDGISYVIGHHFKHRIEDVWPFRTHPQWLSASEAFVERHGGKGLIFGRFIGPLRAFVPMAAGIFQMPFARFFWFNLLSALAWAPVHILPGYALGAAATQPQVFGRDQILFIACLLIVVAVLTWLLPWLVDVLGSWRRRHPLENRGRLYAADFRSENQWLAAWAVVFGLTAFALIALALPWLHSMDMHLATDLQGLRRLSLDRLFLAFSLMGERPTLLTMGGVLLAWLVARREWHTAGYALAAAVLCLFLPPLFKQLFAIPRPELIVSPLDSYAFPSGHAFSAVVVWGFTYMVLSRRLRPEHRSWLLALTLTVIIFTCASRPYLGVHWVSDIAGGIALGVAVLGLLRLGWYRGLGLQVSGWESSAAVTLALFLSCTFVIRPAWPEARAQYLPRLPITAPAAPVKAVKPQHQAVPHTAH